MGRAKIRGDSGTFRWPFHAHKPIWLSKAVAESAAAIGTQRSECEVLAPGFGVYYANDEVAIWNYRRRLARLPCLREQRLRVLRKLIA